MLGNIQLYAKSYQQLADSLINRLPLLPSDTNKTFVYRDISYYLLFSSPDSALIFSRRGYDLAERLLFIPGQIWNLNQQGYAHELNNHFDSALNCYMEALTLARQIEDQKVEANFLNVIGTVYYHQGSFAQAIAYYDAAAQLFDLLNDTDGLAQVLNNLGIVYRIRRNYERAIDVYKQSVSIKLKQNDRIGVANTLRNLGLLYAYIGQAEESLNYLKRAIDIHIAHDNQFEVAACEIGVGSALYTLGRLDEAESVLSKALPRLAETSVLEHCTGLLLIGSIDVQKGRLESGLEKLKQAYDLIKPSGRLDLLKTAEKEMARAAELLGHNQMAVTHWKNFAILSDSLASEQQQWAIEEIMARFESREKENLIQMQSLALAEESAKNKLYFAIGMLFVVLFVSALGYAYNRVRVNRKLKLAHVKTQSALDDKEMLLKEMHHRVKNNLQMLSSLLSLQMREISDEKALGVVQGNRSRLHSIALIHQLLYAREDFRQIDMKRFILNLAGHCEKIYDLKARHIKLIADVDPVLLDIDTATPIGLIINELVVNALKHAFPNGDGGQVVVSLKKQNDRVTLIVLDNGQGFKPESKKSDSFGLKLIDTLAKRMDANLEFAVEQGTKVTYGFNVSGN